MPPPMRAATLGVTRYAVGATTPTGLLKLGETNAKISSGQLQQR